MATHLSRHRRRSIRLQGYDYSRTGAYFVTICTRDRECLFGDVVADKLLLNGFGEIVREEWFRGAQLRPYLRLTADEYVVMPNHVHGILWIVDDFLDPAARARPQGPVIEQFGKPVPSSIPTIIRAFKAATTRRINAVRSTPQMSVWQRNYYEHVIRDEDSLRRVREYIAQNPTRWATDRENPIASASEAGDVWRQ